MSLTTYQKELLTFIKSKGEATSAELVAEFGCRTETPHTARTPKEATNAQPRRKTKAAIEIGIDPGTNTGIAVKYCGVWHTVATMTIIEAIDLVRGWVITEEAISVRIEDARLRTWFGKSGPEKWKGAGSIMRDCSIWEETLTKLGVPFEKVAPKHVKATTAEQFERLTGWKGRTSIHAREAAWMII